MRTFVLVAAVAALAAGCAQGKTAARHGSPPLVIARPVALPPCPPHAPQAVTLDVATTQFVRPGAARLRLCLYVAAHPSRSRAIAGRATISSLISAFNRLRQPHKGIYSCPDDNGSEMLLLFGYRGGRPERVVLRLTGCRFATNGASSRLVTTSLQRRLLALVKHP